MREAVEVARQLAQRRRMSKLLDYSKFDNLDTDSENEAGENDVTNQSAKPKYDVVSSAIIPQQIRGATKPHPTIKDRYIFSFDNQKIYEWEQSLDEVTVYIEAPITQLPKEHTASYISVNIEPAQLQVGLKGADRYFIDDQTFDKVKVKESSWYLDDGVITIVLTKCFRGQTWEGVLRGHTICNNNGTNESSARQGIQESIDPVTKQAMQRTLMLERFQEENPGFDFRDATFNGEVPDPRVFMDGVGYDH